MALSLRNKVLPLMAATAMAFGIWSSEGVANARGISGGGHAAFHGGGYGFARMAPPAPRFERMGIAPSAAHTWFPGHWGWGERGGYVWNGGGWGVGRPGYVWGAPRWVPERGGYRFAPGRWYRR